MTRMTGSDCAAMYKLQTHAHTTRTRTGSGTAEERRRSARNRTIVVDGMWETGETWA